MIKMFAKTALMLAPLALAAPQYIVPAGSTLSVSSAKTEAAAYFLENNPKGNHIFALEINSDGSLGTPVKTSTGGYGSITINATSHEEFTSDSLGSQGSVRVVGSLLFTVNAGSNTLSLFTIDSANPLNPTLVGSPVDTLGEFPISVDYSSVLGKACVLNGGAKAGVSCFNVDPYNGLTADGPLREFSKSIINETTPPTGPPGSAAQVLFSPDSSAVIATIKGNPGASPVVPGSFVAWPVAHGNISTASPTVTHVNGIELPFGFSFLSDDRILVADAASGGAVVHLHSNLTITKVGQATVANQSASCWTWYEPSLNAAYVIDAGTADFYVLNPQTGALTTRLEFLLPEQNSVPGLFDSASYKGLLYSLVGTNGIQVYNLAAGKQVYYLDLSLVGSRKYYIGFAIWS